MDIILICKKTISMQVRYLNTVVPDYREIHVKRDLKALFAGISYVDIGLLNRNGM